MMSYETGWMDAVGRYGFLLASHQYAVCSRGGASKTQMWMHLARTLIALLESLDEAEV